MTRQYFHIIQAMNLTCVVCVVLCLFGMSMHSKAESDNGALTIVQQEDGNDVTLENENSDTDIVADKYEPFYPTNEWQTVNEGQAIPAGLHVRMNFETGVKEAKLLDGEAKHWQDGDHHGMKIMDRKQLSMNELKKALKDFKTTDLDDTDLEREAEVKKKFRSADELKDDFEAMNMDFKTDAEIIERLLTKMKHKEIDTNNLVTVLKDLEYYLHQIDNAILFKDLGGIPYILNIMNQSSEEVLQMEAALVLGAATSSNPKVQIGALEAGALQLLLRLVSVNSSLSLKRKLIYCIATLCRHFPYAQKKFLELGGLVALRNVYEEPGFEKVKVKIVAFLNDLLTEKKLIVENTNLGKTSDSERLKQYNQVHLLEAMLEQGWCDRLTTLLQLSDHESREYVLNTMSTLHKHCKTTFTKSLTDLKVLKSEYVELSKDEDSADDYFTSILSVIESLLLNISNKDEL